MKVIINPEYSFLSNFINELPDTFNETGEIIYNSRNQIRVYSIEGIDIAVKSFKIPIIFNRIAYTYLRKSKAARSYLHGIKLLEMGFNTPTPIAYIETYKSGLLYRSFYISIYDKHGDTIRRLTENKDDYDTEYKLKDLSHFIANIHKENIHHIDLSPGNILISKGSNSKYQFSLIDINRLKFESLSKEEALHNFERLFRSKEISTKVALLYAKERNWNEADTIERVNKYCDIFFSNLAIHYSKKQIRKEQGLLKSLFGPIQLFNISRIFNSKYKYHLYEKYIEKYDWREVIKKSME
jgi:Lipopolysaccharide kinase (Kdo/WaaP) family.